MPDVDDEHSGYGLLVVLVVVVLAAPVLQTTYVGATAATAVEGEPHTVDFANATQLDESGLRYGARPEVTDPDENETLLQGDDYTFNATSGDLQFQNTARLASGERVAVSYTVVRRPATTEAVWTVMQTALGLISLYVLVAALNAIRAWLGWFEDVSTPGVWPR
jgi:hypothetical protein